MRLAGTLAPPNFVDPAHPRRSGKRIQGGQLSSSALKCSRCFPALIVCSLDLYSPHSLHSIVPSGPSTRKNRLLSGRGRCVLYSPVSGSWSTGVSISAQRIGSLRERVACNWPAPSQVTATVDGPTTGGWSTGLQQQMFTLSI